MKYMLLIVAAGLGGLFASFVTTRYIPNVTYAIVGSDAFHRHIIQHRNTGIQQAIHHGDYRCCIQPACTMCYTSPNPWNNYTAGTCACDDIITTGQRPCPQCEDALACETVENE